MTPAEVLRAARALIEKPDRWTRGENARDMLGRSIKPWSTTARCWCSSGAIWRVSYDGGEICGDTPIRVESNDYLREAIDSLSIVEWNDAPERTHAEVLDAFSRAIALAEATRPVDTDGDDE